MNVIIIDFESTGIDTKVARPTEMGAAVFNDKWELQDGMISQLIWESGYPALTPEVSEITGITQPMLSKDGLPFPGVLAQLSVLVEQFNVSFFVAYNRAYDQSLFHNEVQRQGLVRPETARMMQMPWLCAMEDVESNYKKKCWKLSHLALDYGVAVDPSKLHRAMGDVQLTRSMLVAAKATPETMYQFQVSPWLYVKAIVKKPWDDGGKSTDDAKKFGYRWQRAHGTDREFSKLWVKRIKQHDWEKEKLLTPFNIEII